MRITGGRFRGRQLKAPKGEGTRPTQDRVREALFSMLSEVVPGCRFLDLYAGTGAVGLEALSRGAAEVQWVEGDRATARIAAANIAAVAGEDAARNVAVSDVPAWIASARGARPFDIVFADPPYAEGRDGALAGIASAVIDAGIATRRCVFVAEVPVDAVLSPVRGWETVRDRTYGKTRLVIRQRGDEAGRDG